MIIFSGCSTAQRSSEVGETKISVAPYIKMSCKELTSEQVGLLNRAEMARANVDAAHSEDKGKELVAWILFAPAALMMEGNQEQAAELASIKGQLTAVQDALKINNCIVDPSGATATTQSSSLELPQQSSGEVPKENRPKPRKINTIPRY